MARKRVHKWRVIIFTQNGDQDIEENGVRTAFIRDGPLFFWRGGWTFRQRRQFFLVLLSLQTIFLRLLPSANNFFCPSDCCGFHYKLI